MNDSREEHTPEKAREYVAAGELEKAADAYEHLLNRWPNRQDLAEELAELERKRRREKLKTISIEKRSVPGEKTAGGMPEKMKEWLQLLLAYKRIRALKRSRKTLSH